MIPTINVSDHQPIDTLVDKHGDPIMRAPNLMGFGNEKEHGTNA
jgi:hypothetical protein